MRREVSVSLTMELSGDPTEVVAAVALARSVPLESETLHVTVDGRPVEVTELAEAHGGRLHQFTATGQQARLFYSAVSHARAEPPEVDPVDLVRYLRPSRYCESDRLGAVAATEFPGLAGADLFDAVTEWMAERFTYTAGSSQPTDGAVETLLSRRGVCRDYAHVSCAFLRALNVPARVVACYAPGLSPMEFHAVTEAYVDGAWYVLDGTRLAPRDSLLRIATGRDAADTAFLSNYRAPVELSGYQVTAVVDELGMDDFHRRQQLG